jgi:hypothetical protein
MNDGNRIEPGCYARIFLSAPPANPPGRDRSRWRAPGAGLDAVADRAQDALMRIYRLDEMQTRSPADEERERALKAARQRRWRQHERDGVMVVPVEIDGTAINWLRHRVGVLAEEDADDRREIGGAIARMIANSAADWADCEKN